MKRWILYFVCCILYSACATIKVNPSLITLTSFQPFTIDVNIENVNDLYGCGFDLVFNPEKLSVIGYNEGSFLKQGNEKTSFIGTVTQDRVIIGITRQGTISGVSGSGTLARISLKPKKQGDASINFADTSFKNSYSDAIDLHLTPALINILPIIIKALPNKIDVLSKREFTISVDAYDVFDLYGCGFDLVFNPSLMEIENIGKIKEGNLLNKDGNSTSFMRTIKNDRVTIGITRKENVPGVSGTGTLCSITFKTKGFGYGTLSFENISLKDSGLIEGDARGEPLIVNVLPTKIRLEPENTVINLGRACTIDVMVEDQLDLYAGSFDLVFPSVFLGSISLKEGSFLNRDAKVTLFCGTATDGTITIGITRTGNVSGISGNGRLCSITFYGSSSGTSNLTLQNILFSNSQKEPIGIKANVATITTIDVKGKSIKGKAMNLSGSPLSNIPVLLKDEGFQVETLTNNNGEYVFLNPQVGNYEVKIMGNVILSAKTNVGMQEEKELNFSLGDNKAEVSPDKEMSVEMAGTKVIFGSLTFSEKVYVEIKEPLIDLEVKPLVASEIKLIGTNTQLNYPAILELSYPNKYQNPENLRIFKLIENSWRLIGGEVDKENGVVRVNVSSFSTFGIMALNVNSPLKYTYPNPCRVYNGEKTVSFKFDVIPTTRYTIKIYNISGELVKTIENDNKWYLKNDDGKDVASGVYIYIAKGEGWSDVGKIGVIR